MVSSIKNIVLSSKHNRKFLVDVFYTKDGRPKPLVIFSHGFKGFKDWGPYNLVAEQFALAGFVFVKFNFSHNGTTVENPLEFIDLEAFGNDNLTIELDDLGVVIDWVYSEKFPVDPEELNKAHLFLLGHSRGGGISILKAAEDNRISKICTWGSVNEFSKYWSEEELEKIKSDGVVYIPNSRTQQMMPIKWQMYENYFANLPRLFVPDAVKRLQIPFLIIHGTKDETIPVECGIEMAKWNLNCELLLIENGNHNFGAKHPFTENSLRKDLQEVIEASIDFLK